MQKYDLTLESGGKMFSTNLSPQTRDYAMPFNGDLSATEWG